VTGAEALRLVEAGAQLLGLNSKASVFVWTDFNKKPSRVVDLGRTLTGAHAVNGRLAACGAEHASGAWQVVTVDLRSRQVEVIVESSDELPFLNAKILLSPYAPLLAVAWESELRIYEHDALLSRETFPSAVTPRLWLKEGVVVETAEGLRWPAGTADACVHSSPDGRWQVQANASGTLRVGERFYEPVLEADRRAIRGLTCTEARWLGSRHLLLMSDRVVALDLETLKTWLVLEGPETRVHAVLDGRTLVVTQQGSGRPRFVEVSGLS
jgi:hypothetical protein